MLSMESFFVPEVSNFAGNYLFGSQISNIDSVSSSNDQKSLQAK